MSWFTKPHECKYKAQAVTQGTNELQGVVTAVLYVCECGKAKTETFNGHWTIDDLTPRPPTTDAEFLKRAGIKL